MFISIIMTKLYRIKKYLRIIADDDKSVGGHGKKLPMLMRLKYYSLGFSKKEIVYYNFPENDYRNYISATEREKLEDVNGRFAYILGEKVMLERIWGDFIHVPKTYSLIMRGHFLDLYDQSDEVDLIALLKEKGRLIAKPTRSNGGGHGVISLSYEDGNLYINREKHSEADFLSKMRSKNNYMISDWIVPHEYARKVFPQTTNTMRIVTVMNHDTNKAEVLMAVQRFGTKESFPVDNSCSGGVCCFVDIDTGILDYGHDMVHLGQHFKVHPNSGETLEGLQIPNWQSVKKKMTHVHNCFPYYEFLAWDVVIAEDGEVYIIEINRGMDVHWLQVDKPLRNEKLGQYMRKKGMLRAW